jgi:ribosome biogenesis protein ERB1
MGLDDTKIQPRKRKQASDEALQPRVFSQAVDLEMLSDEEDENDVVSDDGGVDEFPEIDTRSDSEDEEVESSDTSGDEENDSDNDSDDSDLHIFPQAKTVTSEITGKLKRVYPDIEPNYDSDSSTEDVWSTFCP